MTKIIKIGYIFAIRMTLEEKVQAVEVVFANLDSEIRSFQAWSGLHCKAGCGKCCTKPDIEATILEFLPFANQLYLQGAAYEWLEKVSTSDSTVCQVWSPTPVGTGLCSQYIHRGLICRLFGYSARTNKYSVRELVTCQVIKTEQPEEFQHAVSAIATGGQVPLMSQYYMQLFSIDMDLTRTFYPINVALRKAIEHVLGYYAYRSES